MRNLFSKEKVLVLGVVTIVVAIAATVSTDIYWNLMKDLGLINNNGQYDNPVSYVTVGDFYFDDNATGGYYKSGNRESGNDYKAGEIFLRHQPGGIESLSLPNRLVNSKIGSMFFDDNDISNPRNCTDLGDLYTKSLDSLILELCQEQKVNNEEITKKQMEITVKKAELDRLRKELGTLGFEVDNVSLSQLSFSQLVNEYNKLISLRAGIPCLRGPPLHPVTSNCKEDTNGESVDPGFRRTV